MLSQKKTRTSPVKVRNRLTRVSAYKGPFSIIRAGGAFIGSV